MIGPYLDGRVSGYESAVLRTAEALAPRHEVHVVPLGRTRSGGPVPGDVRAVSTRAPGPWTTLQTLGTGLAWLPLRHPRLAAHVALLAARARANAAQVLERLQPDVVHVHGLNPHTWPYLDTASRRGLPVGVTVHLLGHHVAAEAGRPWPASTNRKLCLEAARRKIPMTFVSNRLRDDVAQWGVDPALLRVVPNGVDLARFAKVPLQPATEGGMQSVLQVGSLVRRKGHDVMLEAIALLPEGVRATVRYDVVGDGPERDRLEAQAERLGIHGQVVFHGRLDEAALLQAYGRAAIVALPSRREGLSLVVLEAMAAGRPIVAWDALEGLQDVRDDVAAELAPNHTAIDFAAALKRALTRTWDHAAIRERAAAWSWDAVARRYESWYVGLAATASSRGRP